MRVARPQGIHGHAGQQQVIVEPVVAAHVLYESAGDAAWVLQSMATRRMNEAAGGNARTPDAVTPATGLVYLQPKATPATPPHPSAYYERTPTIPPHCSINKPQFIQGKFRNVTAT